MAEENVITEEVADEVTPVEEKKEEIVTDIVEDKVVEDSAKEDKFDASAFSDTPIVKKEEVEEDKDGGLDDDNTTDEDGDDGIIWSGYDDDTEVGDETVIKEEAPVVEDKVTESKEEPQTVSKEAFNQVATELGLKFESIDEMKEHLMMLEEENNKLRKHTGSSASSPAVQKLQDLRNKTDEELVKISLEKDGFEGDDLQDAVDKYIDNGMINIEAKKIRNTIDKAIINEQNKVTQSTVEADAKQEAEYKKSVLQLGEHISKTETMFGFSMAKDKESLGKVQKGHFNYIKSGKFMDDVFKDDQSLSEAAWFVKNKATIIKAISNKSLQQGKQAILDDIREPEVINTQRFKDPKGGDSFDPKAFTLGQIKEAK